ncbi:CLIP domain-containing serine protease B4-like [Toxorhynchites rutilus septentrionalis]|uniref:CLIP domain-containing serine protease B4-like n=1 Tax=Toxorhynchites rutilus septentrionalis TaxID=329112 RepID=UPI00247A48EB|nr:CLIP domain-containing serine protease B4-like [Toxorhynchites rutilus septentrionalis]
MTIYVGLSIALAVIIAGQAADIGESCTDGAGIVGKCKILSGCKSIVNLLLRGNFTENERNYIKKSDCGMVDGSRTVCCPLPQKSEKRIDTALLPAVKDCGRTSASRIVGGAIADLDDYPWLARIQYNKPNNRLGFHCGGVLINDRYVLTAAHCIQSVPASWTVYKVRLGDYDSESDEECSAHDPNDCVNSVQDILVASVYVHEDYFQENGADYNDIALIRLVKPVNYTEYIQPICLPTTAELRNMNVDGLQMTVAGWGQTETRSASRYKMYLNVPAWNNTRCGGAFEGVNVDIIDSQLCAGGEVGKDSCRGDSGGPLMKVEKIGGVSAWFLKGIVSFGTDKCGTENIPGVYTRISKYMDWIQENIED